MLILNVHQFCHNHLEQFCFIFDTEFTHTHTPAIGTQNLLNRGAIINNIITQRERGLYCEFSVCVCVKKVSERLECV